VLCWLVLLSLMLVSACRRQPTVTTEFAVPTAEPFPTPDEHAIYAMMTEKYTSWYAIFSIGDISADEAARILTSLLAIQPPADLEVMHEQAVDAYRNICMGKLLLPTTDNLVRAEAHFLVDWGVGRLLDYREKLDALP
jgi:hypothetical protein